MKRCDPFEPLKGEIETMAKMWGLSIDAATAWFYDQQKDCEFWEDDLLQVVVKPVSNMGPFRWQVMVRRKDRNPLGHPYPGCTYPSGHWFTMQRIKNEIFGDHTEAVELYPNKNRTYDTSNTYHLWVTEMRLPFGYHEGLNADTKGT